MKSLLASTAAVFAGIIVLGATLGTAAASEDDKVYPGASCQPLTQSALFQRSIVNGQITNTSSATQTFICPAVRDATGDVSSIEFAGITLTGSATSTCQLVTVTTAGTRAALNPSAIRPISETLRRVQFAEGDFNFGSPFGGTIIFVCSIASRGGILAYSITENDGEQ